MKRNILNLIALLEFFVVLLFFFAGYMAGTAMDKTGTGNLSLWIYWSNICGESVAFLLFLWLCSLIIAIREKYRSGARGVRLAFSRLNTSQALAVAGPVLMLLLGYLLYVPYFILN